MKNRKHAKNSRVLLKIYGLALETASFDIKIAEIPIN